MELLGNQSFPFSFAFKTSSLVTNAIQKMSNNYPKNTLFQNFSILKGPLLSPGDQVSDASALSQQPV